jgi:hypothetical protein
MEPVVWQFQKKEVVSVRGIYKEAQMMILPYSLDNQDTVSPSQGHLLYALTEVIADKLEMPLDSELFIKPFNSESSINLKVVGLFNKVKNHIAISRDCSISQKSYLKLKVIVDKLIPLMVVPLLHRLLYYLSIKKLTTVKVYETTVLPLFLACTSATYHKLKSILIDGTPSVDYPDPSDLYLVKIKKDYVVLQIQSMYSCLGLTCDLVGSTKNEAPECTLLASSICNGNSDLKSLDDYKYLAEQENRSSVTN